MSTDGDNSNTTTAIVAAVCSLISGLAGAFLAKLPDWLKYRRASSQDSRKAKREDNDILTENYATMLARMQAECSRLLERANERQAEFDQQQEKIEALQASHLKCIEEHAETKGELRAILLHLGLKEPPRSGPVNIGITLKEKSQPGAEGQS